MTEKQILYQAQLKSQKEETKEARINLSEAQEEISNIIERKRNLLKGGDQNYLVPILDIISLPLSPFPSLPLTISF